MSDKSFIFAISSSILVPETNKKPFSMFIYSAKEVEEFFSSECGTPKPVYGKFKIANDNYEPILSNPPYFIS